MASILDWTQGPWQTAAVVKRVAEQVSNYVKDKASSATAKQELDKLAASKPMAQNKLQDFVTSIRKTDLARPGLFEVEIVNPNVSGKFKDISLLCKTAQFPQTELRTSTNRDFGMEFQVPVQMQHGDVTLTFYVDTGMNIKRFFEMWIDLIYDSKTNEINFYEEYVFPIKIKQLNAMFQMVYSVELDQCYPKSVGQLRLDNSSQGTVSELDVTFAFVKFSEATSDSPMGTSPSSISQLKGLTTLDTLADPTKVFDSYRNVGNMAQLKETLENQKDALLTKIPDKFNPGIGAPAQLITTKITDVTSLFS